MAKERAEHLLILREACNGLLCRAHWMIHSSKPTSLESKELASVLRFLRKSFPKISAKDANQQKGYDTLRSKAETIQKDLEDWYLTLCDVISFNEKLLGVLKSFCEDLTRFREDNYHLMILFFELFAGYVKLQLAIQRVPAKLRNISVYIICSEITQGRKDQHIDKVLKYMNEMMGNQDWKPDDSPWVTISNLRSLCEPFTNLLRESTKYLWSSVQKWAPSESFERNRMFSILHDASKIVQPSRTDRYLELENINGIREWLQYALLVCPAALQEQSARSCLNKIIGNYFVIPIVRNMTFDLMKTWDKTFREFKCGHISKNTKFYLKSHRDIIFKDAYQKANECALNHRSLRRYLQTMLRQYVCLFTEVPGLAAPKFQLVLALIGLASNEIHWYFRHTTATPYKSNKVNWIPKLATDYNIIKLIAACVDLCHIVSKHSNLVQDYFIEYIRNIDAPRCTTEMKSLLQKHGQRIPLDMQNLMTVFTNEAREVNPKSNFVALHLNFFRIASYLCSRSSGIPPEDSSPLLYVFGETYSHFCNVLQTKQRLVRTANLGSIIWYKEDIRNVLGWTLNRPDLNGYCMTLMQMLGHVKYDLNLKYCPDEQANVIKYATQWAEITMDDICRTTLRSFDNTIQWSDYLSNQGGLREGISKLESITNKKARNKIRIDTPGLESKYGSQQYMNAQAQAQGLGRLLGAIRDIKQIQIFKTVINTYDWLYEALDGHVDEKIGQLFGGEHLRRPTEALASLKSIQRALSYVEQHIALNTSDILRGNVLKHFTDIRAGMIGESLKTDTKTKSLVQRLGHFYWDLITKDYVAFCPLKKHFVTKPHHHHKKKGELRAEGYTAHPELRALCHIIGPYGIKAIQSVLLSNLSNDINKMKQILSENSVYLGQLNFDDMASWWTQVQKINGRDDFLNYAIQVGRCLQFISMLKNAQRSVQEDDIPFVSQIINLVMRRIESDGNITPGKQLCNVLTDSGIEDPMYDQGAKEVFQKSFSSGVVLSHFPKMFACLYLSQVWKSSRFEPESEGFNTGVESVITTIQTIIPAICGTRNKSMEMLREYVILSAYTLIHMTLKAESKDREMRDYHIPSMMVFISKFMETCKGISMHVLEECLPYTLMRTKIIEIYERIHIDEEGK
eukprot:CAMPEP_0184493278 /NCGR_PEP_ID=MMETSP0113_2-20130426/25544_1 /TAXON_ID=91329 /ORGANISM="Norrisiella sphaerica, Strain BC52" /LENGTH=1134 /DNA_ID=CAMNT_0026878481 /DNA_START=27 /DNA_END=3431 /DNA_ORIENTATION=+